MRPSIAPPLWLSGASLAVYLAAMTDAEHKDHDFSVVHLVDHPVVADADAHFSGTALELFTARWSRILRERVDAAKDAPGTLTVEPAQGLDGRTRIGDLVLHVP